MLHTKFHGNRPAGSGVEDFLVFFFHIWAWRPSWSCDLDFAIKLSSPLPMDAQHKIFTLINQAVSEKKIIEKCVWTTDWSRSRDDLDLN